MSFLNPVSLPVKRFSSTDTDAPQINYAARTAGDVKAVLKACLVDGYGTTASAGWSAVNEVSNVIEFVSPSAAMSDYRFGVDDSTATKTDWYYQYQDVRKNPDHNAPVKSIGYIDKSHVDNGWQLLVTERGMLFIEITQHTVVAQKSARITYMGQVKSMLVGDQHENMMFYNLGMSATTINPSYFYDRDSYTYFKLADYDRMIVSAAQSDALKSTSVVLDVTTVDVISDIYIAANTKSLMLAQLPCMRSKHIAASANTYGIVDSTLDTRPVLDVVAGSNVTTSVTGVNAQARRFLIPLDYWDY